MNIQKVITLSGLFFCLFSADLFANKGPIDEREKAWYYQEEEQRMVFIKKDGSYMRGDLQIPLNSSKAVKSYLRDGGLKSIYYETGRAAVVLDFYPKRNTDREKNLVYSSRVYLKVSGQLLLHEYMYLFERDRDLLFISRWQQGVLDGEYLVFDGKGNVRESRHYTMGYPIKEWRQYYPTGVLASTVSFPEAEEAWGETEDYVYNQELPSNSRKLSDMPYILSLIHI